MSNSNSAQHTPGPWFAKPADIWRDASGRMVQTSEYQISAGSADVASPDYYRIASISNVNDSPQNAANARLFLAAPDLLVALQAAVEAYGRPGGPWNVPGDKGGWLANACAAIAKATGGAQ